MGDKEELLQLIKDGPVTSWEVNTHGLGLALGKGKQKGFVKIVPLCKFGNLGYITLVGLPNHDVEKHVKELQKHLLKGKDGEYYHCGTLTYSVACLLHSMKGKKVTLGELRGVVHENLDKLPRFPQDPKKLKWTKSRLDKDVKDKLDGLVASSVKTLADNGLIDYNRKGKSESRAITKKFTIKKIPKTTHAVELHGF